MNIVIQKNLKNIFLYVLIGSQFYLVNESAPMMLKLDKLYYSIIWVLISFMIVLFGIVTKKLYINKKMMFVYFFCVLGSIITTLLNQDYMTENIYFPLAITSAFFMAMVFEQKKFIYTFSNVLIFYSVYSLISTYIILPLYMNGLFNFLETYTSVLKTPFLDTIFSFSVAWHGIMRNQGIFREPGVFQFYLLVGLIIEISYRKKIKKLNVLIIFIALISTFSTIGFISLILISVGYLIKQKYNRKKILTTGLSLASLTVLSLILFKKFPQILEKISSSFQKISDHNDNFSTIVRTESIFNNIIATFNSPIWGNNFVNGYIFIKNNLSSYQGNDITGTNFSYMMALGIPIGILIITLLYQSTTMLSHNEFNKYAVFIALFVSLNSQNLVYSSLLWTIIFFPYMKKGEEKEVKYEENQIYRIL